MNYILTDADKAKIEQALEKAETLVIGSMPNTHPWSQQMREALSILRALPAQVEQEAGEHVAVVVSSGPHEFPLLQWRSAEHSLNTPIGTKLYASPTPAAPAAQTEGWFLPLDAVNSIQAESIDRLIRRAKHAHHADVDLRINGQNEHHEADWIKHMERAK